MTIIVLRLIATVNYTDKIIATSRIVTKQTCHVNNDSVWYEWYESLERILVLRKNIYDISRLCNQVFAFFFVCFFMKFRI